MLVSLAPVHSNELLTRLHTCVHRWAGGTCRMQRKRVNELESDLNDMRELQGDLELELERYQSVEMGAPTIVRTIFSDMFYYLGRCTDLWVVSR